MKRSAAGSSGKPPETIILILDENLSGRSILAGLAQRGLPVMPQTDYAPRGVTDADLVSALSKHPHLVLVTKDRDFRYKQDLVNQLMKAGLRVFALTSAGNRQGADLVDQISAAWPAMQRFIARHPPPFVIKVGNDGALSKHHG